MGTVRTRFAPSPTGRMHVGNLRTALYAFLIAKHEDGKFLLRIEDTDQVRKFDGAVDIIYNTMKKTGLTHDEGPDKDGGYGPYVQSERMASGIYLEYAKKLVEEKKAYYCFCTKERLEGLTQVVGGKEINVYDKHCLHLSQEEIDANLASGMPYVIRQNNPNTGTTTFHDEIYGDISVDNSELDDMILIKSDGYPTYNFANVIDDHLMGITHVVRGNEYLSSTPKYNRLYDAFGWEIPVYVHCPLITDEEHKKLSKRSGHSSFEDLLEQGFVSEAIVNFVSLLGWSPEDNVEMMSLQELIEKFDYRHMSKSPAVFDFTKLKWLNGEYFKAMSDEKFYDIAKKYADVNIPEVEEGQEDSKKAIRDKIATYRNLINSLEAKGMDLHHIMRMVRTRIEVVPDIIDHVDFFDVVPDYDNDMYNNKKSKCNPEISLSILTEVLEVLKNQDDFSNDALFATLSEYAASKEYKTGLVMWPLRTALSGKQMTPGGATEIMEILGKEESIKRIEAGIKKLS